MTEIIYVKETAEQIAEREAWAAGAFQREYETITSLRQSEYTRLSDPVFMQYQRGEATKQQWLDAVQAIKDAYPYPVKEGK